MDDAEIVALYFSRDERALRETAAKYGRYCYTIACNILAVPEDAEESVNDAYLGAWDAIPPHRPAVLSTFLGKLTRRAALKKWRARDAGKRGGGETALALDELGECVPAGGTVDEALTKRELARAINAFLDTLPPDERRVFVRRYWYLDSIKDIRKRFTFSESKVKSMLYRTREKLREYLRKEGFWER